jgi:hypothetical protein
MRQPIPMNLQQAIMNRNMFQPAVQRGMPNINSGIMNVQYNQQQQPAQSIGLDIFRKNKIDGVGLTSLLDSPLTEKGMSEKIKSLATDNTEEVAPELQAFHSNNQELATLLGAVTSVTEKDKELVDLYKDMEKGLVNSPEEAKERVREFFPNLGKKEVPVWADVATNVGIELIKSGDLGTALEVGQKTAKASRAAKTQKDLMLSQLAFGVYKEDTKQAQNIKLNLKKLDISNENNIMNYKAKIAKVLRDIGKDEDAVTEKKANALMSIVNSFPAELRGKAGKALAGMPAIIAETPLDKLAGVVYSKLSEDTDFANVLDSMEVSKYRTSELVKISSEEQFNTYKRLFPNSFEGIEFDSTRTKPYELTIYGDKRDGIGTEKFLTSENTSAGNLVIPPKEAPSSIVKLNNELRDTNKRISDLEDQPNGKNSLEYQQLTKQRDDILGAIQIQTTRQGKQMFVVGPDGMMAVGDAKGIEKVMSLNASMQAQKELDANINAFSRVVSLSERVLINLASLGDDEAPGGFVVGLQKRLSGLKDQIGSGMTSLKANGYDGNINDLTGSDFSALYNSTSSFSIGGKTYKSGDIFQNFDKAVGQNQELRSLLTDLAFAMASSRETGKLTDKDVAYALFTIGGRAVVEGYALTNKAEIVSGITTTVKIINDELGNKANNLWEGSRNAFIKENGENHEGEIKYWWDPIRELKKSNRYADIPGQSRWQNQLKVNPETGDLEFNMDYILERSNRQVEQESSTVFEPNKPDDYTNLINALNVNNNKGTLTTNVLRTLLSDYQSKGGNITAGLVNDLKSKFPDVFK